MLVCYRRGRGYMMVRMYVFLILFGLFEFGVQAADVANDTSLCRSVFSFSYPTDGGFYYENGTTIPVQTMPLRKLEWQKVLPSIAYTYANKADVEKRIRDYVASLCDGVGNKLGSEYGLSDKGGFQMNVFRSFYRFIPFLSNKESIFRNFNTETEVGWGFTGVRCTYKLPFGMITSSWNLEKNRMTFNFRIPLYAPTSGGASLLSTGLSQGARVEYPLLKLHEGAQMKEMIPDTEKNP